MNILLIRPSRPPQAITIGEFMFCEPLGLEAVYGVLKKKHDVSLLDMMIEQVDLAEYLTVHKPDVVGITSLCIDVTSVLELAGIVKKVDAEIPVVVGGTQAQLVPRSFDSPVIDYIMTHATVSGLNQLFDSLAKKQEAVGIAGVQNPGHGLLEEKFLTKSEYIVPDRESTMQYRSRYSYFGYKPCAILQTSQGCSKCCSFCLRWRIEGAREVHQDMEIVFEQIRNIHEPSIMIVDNDFLCDGSRLDALCDFVQKEKIHKNFICYGSVHSVLKNRDSVKRFAASGLKAVMVGYESFKPEELSGYNKKATVADNLAVSRLLRKYDVDVWASFILHPDWDRNDFKKFRKYIRQLRPQISSLSPLTPFPGLPYFEEYRHRLLYDETAYEQWSFGQLLIRPEKMSVKSYYIEILKINMYINFFMNNALYLVRKFGFGTLFRLAAGGLRLSVRYLACMLQVEKIPKS
jgi:radical SAM superfamily enzyme YgiQ (UPF0313 family)